MKKWEIVKNECNTADTRAHSTLYMWKWHNNFVKKKNGHLKWLFEWVLLVCCFVNCFSSVATYISANVMKWQKIWKLFQANKKQISITNFARIFYFMVFVFLAHKFDRFLWLKSFKTCARKLSSCKIYTYIRAPKDKKPHLNDPQCLYTCQFFNVCIIYITHIVNAIVKLWTKYDIDGCCWMAYTIFHWLHLTLSINRTEIAVSAC